MLSNWQSQELERPPIGALLLIAMLAVVTSLTLALIFAPKIFQHAFISCSLVTALAVLTTLFTALIYGEYLSRPILAAFLAVTQLLALLGWMQSYGLSFALFHSPSKLVASCYEWFIPALSAGLIPVGFTVTLRWLSRSPHRQPLGIKESGDNAFEVGFRETWGNLLMPIEEQRGWDYSFWEQEWNRWRLMIIMLFLVVLGIAIIGAHLRQAPIRCFLLEGLILAVFSICFLLLTCGYRLYKRAVWVGEALDTSHFSSRDWLRWTVCLLGVAFLITLILPTGYGIRIHSGHSAYVQRPQDIVAFKERHQQEATGLMDVVLGNALGGTLLAFLTLGLIAVLIFPLIIFGGVFFNFDSRKLRVFMHIFRKLMVFWQGFHQEILRLNQEIFNRNRSDGWDARPADEENKRTMISWGKGPRAIVRRGYYRLVSRGQAHGIVVQKYQTSSEIGESLKKKVAGEDQSIDNMTEIYQAARYGPLPPNPESVKAFEQLRKTVQEKLSLPQSKQ